VSFKVLHLNTFDNGGAAIAAKRLHMALLKNGIDSSMLFREKLMHLFQRVMDYNQQNKQDSIVWRTAFPEKWEVRVPIGKPVLLFWEVGLNTTICFRYPMPI
jgi:hypothetical protein